MVPTPKSSGSIHQFGGDWTAQKLEVLSGYLGAYTKVLKHQPFRTAYIDAFAGSGTIDAHRDGEPPTPQSLLFPELVAEEPKKLLDGSARIALQTQPRFDKYIFIERRPDRCAELERLKSEFPDLALDIDVRPGEANAQIQALCAKKWDGRRAVLFLDPYGMQVEWQTIEAVARTKAIDLWILFPLGIGVNRLLTKSGDIPQSWRRRLDLLLGTTDWYDEFYEIETTPTLFGETERLVKATMETIGRYFNDRLREIFAGVAEQPGVLRNSSSPLYLLCFAVSNEKACKPALRIAEHLLKGVR
jgi:three-Cys-motif partner protein